MVAAEKLILLRTGGHASQIVQAQSCILVVLQRQISDRHVREVVRGQDAHLLAWERLPCVLPGQLTPEAALNGSELCCCTADMLSGASTEEASESQRLVEDQGQPLGLLL